MAPVNADIVALAQVKGGKLVFYDRRAFDQQVVQMRPGSIVEVCIMPRRATRSLDQNRYYWGVVVQALSEHTGYTPEEIHDVLKAKFIPKRVAFQDGNGEVVGEFVLGGSTRVMNKQQFSEYVTNIKMWAAEELDVYIPDANEVSL